MHHEAHIHVHVQDRAMLTEATELMACFGEHAQMEVATRANHSRSIGNVVRFCHWRQIGRTIGMLSAAEVTGTIN